MLLGYLEIEVYSSIRRCMEDSVHMIQQDPGHPPSGSKTLGLQQKQWVLAVQVVWRLAS